MIKLKHFFILIVIIASVIFGQTDSTRSQAFKDSQPRRTTYFKAKYPSYSLLAGYLLVTEANRGDPFAQHELAIRYLIGQGFSPDTVKSVYWFRKAVDQNLPAARFNYGILLHNGIGVPWNPYEAYSNFKSAANAGLPEAQFACGLLLTDNFVVNRNYGEAYKLFQSSAKGNYQPAKDALNQMKKSGFIPPSDSSTNNSAIRYDDMAQLINPQWDLDFYDFDKNEKDSLNEVNVESILNKKSSDLKRYLGLDDEKSNVNLADTTGLAILKFAADNGSPEAILLSARSYEKGLFHQKNLITASLNYLRAYRLGSFKAGEYLFKLLQEENFFTILKERVAKKDNDAMYVLAGITALGFTNQISNDNALELLKNAAAKNHIPSVIELGICYNTGTLVKKDLKKAIDYWRTAEKMGSSEAQIRISFSLAIDSTQSGIVGDQIKNLIDFSNQGSVLAQTYLGYCYEKGIGVKENKGIAVKHYRQAAQRGNQSAYNSLKRLYDEIRPLDEEFKIYSTD